MKDPRNLRYPDNVEAVAADKQRPLEHHASMTHENQVVAGRDGQTKAPTSRSPASPLLRRMLKHGTTSLFGRGAVLPADTRAAITPTARVADARMLHTYQALSACRRAENRTHQVDPSDVGQVLD